MSHDIAVKVSNLSKSFKLPHEKHSSIKSLVISGFKGRRTYEKQQVLKDISFEIRKGEFFGIVGRNGSGKSTLLKLMAGIYSPNSGGIKVDGKLVPFIELGVGFNPELTGRENVYLNSSLLGFSREEVDGIYDEIVEFAELRRFMDQKLKNYSSGMQVRLAFSIAIQAKGDILLLDEVLAVGDEAFQKKCNNYFEELKNQNKTVILVTHNMDAVKRYCSRAMLLENGKVKKIGSPTSVANQYSLDNLNTKSQKQKGKDLSLTELVKRLDVRLLSPTNLTNSDYLEFEIEYELNQTLPVDLGIAIVHQNFSVIEHNTKELKLGSQKDVPYKLRYKMPLKHLTAKQFSINAAIFEKKDFKLIGFNTNACSFIITSNKPGGGVLNRRGEWTVMEKSA